MLEVIKEFEEFCYILCLWIVYDVKEFPLDVLPARPASYYAHLTDSDMSVSRVIVALEGAVEAFDVVLEDFGRAGTIVIEEVYKSGCHADEHPYVAFLDVLAKLCRHLQPLFLIALVAANIIVLNNDLCKCLIHIFELHFNLAY